MGVHVYDGVRGEVVDAETGEVVVDHVIDHGPEWRSYKPERRRCHVMYRRVPVPLRFFRGLVPRYVLEDAVYIVRGLGLSGRAAALAALMYSCRRFGVALPVEAARMISGERRSVYRVYRRIVEELGVPRRGEDAVAAQVAAVAARLGRPQLARVAVELYRRLRERNQGHRSLTLAAVALVKAGFPAGEAAGILGVAPSTLSKALRRVEA